MVFTPGDGGGSSDTLSVDTEALQAAAPSYFHVGQQMSKNKDLWTLDSLQTSPEWKQVRLLAESLLSSFQISKQSPDLFWLQYVPGQKESS